MQFLRNYSLRKTLSAILAMALLQMATLSSASADVVSTEDILQSSQTAEQRAALQDFTARADVKQMLLDYGVSESAIDERIANLTDAEVQQMHEQIESMPAGQGLLGTVIGLLVIFMLLDIAGVTDIFPAL